MATTWTKVRAGLEQVATSRLRRKELKAVRTHRCRRCGTEITTRLTHIRHCHICGTTLPT